MAKASIEFGGIDAMRGTGSSINGKCWKQEELAVGASTTMTAALVQGDFDYVGGLLIARIAVDVDTYVATGSNPDPTAVTANGTTSARRRVAAGGSIELPLVVGDKVGVKAF